MSDFVTIFKMMIKSGTFQSGFQSRRKGKTKKYPNPLKSIVLLVILFTVISFAQLYGVILTLQNMETAKADVLLALAGNSITFLLFLTLALSATTVFSMYFLNNDDQFYLHLPIKPTTIFAARFTAAFILGCLVPIGVPIAYSVAYHIVAGAFNPLVILNSFIVYFGFEILFSSAIILLGLLLSEVFKLKKHRQMMSVICFSFIFAGIFLYSFSSASPALSNAMNGLFYYPIVSLLGVDYLSFLYALAVLGIGVAALMLIFLLARFFYLHAITGSSDGRGQSKKVSTAKMGVKLKNSTKRRHPYFHYLRYEFKTLFKSGTYFFNLLFPSLIFPIMIAIVIFTVSAMVGDLVNFQPLTPLFLGAAVALCVSFSPGSGVCYSKDRLDFLYIYTTPCDQHAFLRAKLTPAFLICIISTLFLVLALIFLPPFNADWLQAGAIGVSALALGIGLQYMNSMIDLRFGGVTDASEIYICKQSKMIILTMLSNMIAGVLLLVCPLMLTVLVKEVHPFVWVSLTLALTLSFGLFMAIFAEKHLHHNIRRFINH